MLKVSAPFDGQARYVTRRVIKLSDYLVAEPSFYVRILLP